MTQHTKRNSRFCNIYPTPGDSARHPPFKKLPFFLLSADSDTAHQLPIIMPNTEGCVCPTRCNSDGSILDLNPERIHSVLQKTRFLKGNSKMPKLGQILNSHKQEIAEAHIILTYSKGRAKEDKNNIYCLAPFSGTWRTTIHK